MLFRPGLKVLYKRHLCSIIKLRFMAWTLNIKFQKWRGIHRQVHITIAMIEIQHMSVSYFYQYWVSHEITCVNFTFVHPMFTSKVNMVKAFTPFIKKEVLIIFWFFKGFACKRMWYLTIFYKRYKGYLKNHWTNTEPVCTYLKSFLWWFQILL